MVFEDGPVDPPERIQSAASALNGGSWEDSNLKRIPASDVELVPVGYPHTPSSPGQVCHAFAFGGHADVFKAEMRVHGADGSESTMLVAVKVFRGAHIKIDKDPEKKLVYLKRLRREYGVWGDLSHKNILQLEGVLDHPSLSSTALVSEFKPLGDLANFIKTTRPFDRLSMIKGIACGVKYLHSMKNPVVHGDIALRNILVDEAGEDNFIPLITDFGKSRVLEKDGYTTKAGGPMLYQPPELLRAQMMNAVPTNKDMFTPASDVYSLSLVMLELLTGRAPYSMDGYEDLPGSLAIIGHGRTPLRPTQEKYPLINESDAFCWPILEACWKCAPSDRISSLEAYRLLNAGGPRAKYQWN